MKNSSVIPDKHSESATQDYAAGYYEDVRYHLPSARRYYDWFFRKLFSLVEPQGRILDNGCGVGIVGDYLKGHQLVGIDLSPKMVEHARKRMPEVYVGDSQALPFPDASFDTVLSLSLLHHLPDPKRGVEEVARVLKPGGLAIFEEVVKTSVSILPRYLLNRHSSHFSHEHKNFTKSELMAMIKDHFHVDRVRNYGYLAYPLLGFPDVINFERFLPFKKFTIPYLLWLDDFIERIPLIRSQSWNIIIVARKL